MPDTDPSSGLWKRLALPALAALVSFSAHAQTLTPPTPVSKPAPGVNQPAPLPQPAPTAQPAPAPSGDSGAIDQLTQSNRELLDLLKKQQGVLEDMQFDRRLPSCQIE